MKELNQPHKNKKKGNVGNKMVKNQQKKVKDVSTIEQIFQTAKKKKVIEKKEVDPKEVRAQKLDEKLKKQWKIQQKLRKVSQGTIVSAVKTQGGVKIYTEQDLKLGKGGNTSKCPIDCDCCF